MKKALIAQLLLVLLLPLGAFCQLTKGSYLGSFSAGLGYSHNKNSEPDGWDYSNSIINFYISDNMGFFVVNRLAIGPGISLNLQHNQYTDNNSVISEKSHSTVYSAAFNPFIRYYFASKGNLAFFVQANGSIGYGQEFYKSSSDKETTNILTYSGGAGIGLVYFIIDHIGLETQLAYNYTGNNIKMDQDKNNSVKNDIELRVGLNFYFSESKKQEDTGDQKK